jgi:DNA-binding NtrC family response regulator
MEKLLVIGKSLDGQNNLAILVKQEGYQLLTADNKQDGLVLLNKEQPAIVMVDHKLEDDDGVNVLKEIRKQMPRCEVVLVTPGGEVEAAIEVLKLGALDYLRQPIDAGQLRVALERARERKIIQNMDILPTILVLEDHQPTLDRLARVLRKEGYLVYTASDGDEGMKIYNENRIDIILADVRMPQKDGLRVLRETKGAGGDVEVIVITGYGDEDVVVQALRYGAIDFLRKPIDIEQTLLAIEKAYRFETMRRSQAYRNMNITSKES